MSSIERRRLDRGAAASTTRTKRRTTTSFAGEACSSRRRDRRAPLEADASIHELVTRVLTRAGYSVVGTSGGDEAMRGRRRFRSAGGDFGAGDGDRTRDLELGKLRLYQLSYARSTKGDAILSEKRGGSRRHFFLIGSLLEDGSTKTRCGATDGEMRLPFWIGSFM